MIALLAAAALAMPAASLKSEALVFMHRGEGREVGNAQITYEKISCSARSCNLEANAENRDHGWLCRGFYAGSRGDWFQCFKRW